jgi:hypothetical protein
LAISSLIGSACCGGPGSFSDLDVVGSSPAEGCDTVVAQRQSARLCPRPIWSSGRTNVPARCEGWGYFTFLSDNCSLDQTFVLGPHPPVRCEERGSFWRGATAPPFESANLVRPVH